MSQLALDLAYRTALGREDFLVAACNRDAVAWIDRWRDWPLDRLALHGLAGSGKTHLLEVWRRESGAVPVAPGDLAAADLDALVPAGGCLALDDADALAGDPAGERALFHLINLAGERKAQLLLVGRDAPARWPVALPDLASRLAATASIAIAPPDEELMAALLVKLFADRQAPLTAEAVAYLVPRMERSFSAALELVRASDRLSLAERKRITVPLARRVLAALPADLAGRDEGL